MLLRVRVPLCVAFSLALTACAGDDLRGNIAVIAPAAWQPALGEFVALTPYGGLALGERDGAYRIELVADGTVVEGYQLEYPDGTTIRVHAHDVLGAQYGTAAALEAMGFRFRHPFDTHVPQVPVIGAIDPAPQAPEVRVRGLQLHTLHPIEGYFAFWEPGAGSANDAHRIIDWVIKNRGNYLQWVALDDILDPARHEAWKTFTRELIDDAHLRGIRVGLNLQLFGQSNLQFAFDLSDDRTGTVPIGDEIAARLPLVTDGLPFDVYDLSFGEFFNADPQRFIDAVNEVQRQLARFAPQAEMHAVVHLGATQRVTYMGEDLIYYFLVKYANPAIVSEIHTVMFYDLFEPTGGAYHHENFDEHRAYLQQQMCAGKPAAYFPETAYWVAFDDSVPQFFPIYVHNRQLDLAKLRESPGGGACGTLDEHLLFSSGWEWGYWLNDVTALRASYKLASPEELIAAELGPDVAPVLGRLADLQREHVMLGGLIGYLVGRDATIDLGRTLGIVSQPDRLTFDQLVAGQDDPVHPIAETLGRLATYADALDGIARTFAALDRTDDRWTRELRDGIEIDGLRAHFVEETYQATLAHIAGDAAAATGHFTAAHALLDRAHTVVTARDADLHDSHGRRLLDKTPNQTFYQFGYLFMADTLCYWQRELDQVGNILGTVSTAPGSCFF